MKVFLLLITIIIVTSCGQNTNKKDRNDRADNVANNDEIEIENKKASDINLIEFKGNKFTIGYPDTWSLNQKEMDNPSSIAHITAILKITENRAITFQLMNLVDTASLEIGVKNLITKYSKNAQYSEFKKMEANNYVFLNTRIKFAVNVSSECYFLKDGDNLFWLSFMGNVRDLDEHNHEFYAIVKSFVLNNNDEKSGLERQ